MIYHSRIFLATIGVALISFSGLNGQSLTFITADWSDSFREWTLLDEEENEIGSIDLTWGLSDNWSSWTIETDEIRTEMRQKYSEDPNTWEAHVNGRWIEARTVFPDKMDVWRIKYDDEQYTLEQVWRGRWKLRRSDAGEWAIEMYYANDPRDWVIIKDRNWPIELETFFSMLVIAHIAPRE